MSIKEEYMRNGVVVVKNFYSVAEVDALRNEAKQIFSIQIKKNGIDFDEASESEFENALYKLFQINYNAFLGAAKAAQQMISLFNLTCNAKVKDLLSSIGLTHPVICVKPIIYFNSRNLAKIEGHYKTPAHQDWRSMQGSLNSVVIWVPLIDMSTEIGNVEFIPGSHMKGLLDTETDEWYRHIKDEDLGEKSFTSYEVKKGDAVVFSAFTVHRSGDNITDRIRWSIHVRYNDLLENTFMDRNYPHPYKVYAPDSQLVTPNFPTQDLIKKTFKE